MLYVSGEESPQQIALRAKRLGVDAESVIMLPDTDLSRIEAAIKAEKPEVAVIDSIQTLTSASCSRRPAPSRRCANARRA